MDPLSVAASIAGLLSAAASISKVMGPYVAAARDTPQIAHHVNSEVQAASIILSALQSLANNMASVSIQRAALVDVDQVVAVLTSGVFVFSDLEASVGTLPLPDSSSISRLALRSRFQWARKETEFTALLSRLQSFKSSISLILDILQSDTSLRAEQRQADLVSSVNQLLENNRDLSRRLMNLEDSFDAQTIVTKRQSIAGSIASKTDSERRLLPSDAGSSTARSQSPVSPEARLISGFEFEDDLKGSGPYRRAQRDTMDFSFRSSIARSHAWSIFSGLSLGDISVMAVIALPVYADEITNPGHYEFGGQRLSMLPFTDGPALPLDHDSLLRRCLRIQLQLCQLPGLDALLNPPSPLDHPFKTIQRLVQQGTPLVSLCRCFKGFNMNYSSEDLHPWYYKEPTRVAKDAAYWALKAVSESPPFRFKTDCIPTVTEVLSGDAGSFLKVISMIEKILTLECKHELILAVDAKIADTIRYSSGHTEDSDTFLLLDDFARQSWKMLRPLIGLTSDDLVVGALGLLDVAEWQAMFMPVLRILETELKFLLEVEVNLLRPPAGREWSKAFDALEERIADYGQVIGSYPRNSKLLRSRADGADLPRIQAIAKALDHTALPSRLIEIKSEFLSVRSLFYHHKQ
jgi:cell division control protein 24